MKKNATAKRFINELYRLNKSDKELIHNLSLEKALEFKNIEQTLAVTKISEKKAEALISKKIYLEHPELVKRYEFTSMILNSNNGSIIELNRLIDLFNDLSFTEEEQADIMGYYIKDVIVEMLKFRDNVFKTFNIQDSNSKEAKDAINKYISMTFMGYRSNDKYELIPKDISSAEVISALEKLDLLLDIDGTLLPNNAPDDLENLFDQTFIQISKEQIFLLKAIMMKRYAKKAEIEARKTTSAKPKDDIIDFEKQKQLKSKRHNAMQLVNRFIDENGMLKDNAIVPEITKLTEALIVLDYKDEVIMRIQKEILARNSEIEKEIKERKIAEAVNRYLTRDNAEIVEEAKIIVSDINYIDSPFYQAIKNNYNCVIDLILQASLAELYTDVSYLSELEYLKSPAHQELNITTEDDYELSLAPIYNNDMTLEELLELIEIGIMDLAEALRNYKLSDYHFARIAKKED